MRLGFGPICLGASGLAGLVLLAGAALASGGGDHGGAGLGSALPLYLGIPFVGILLSIALFPLVAPRVWHHHFGKLECHVLRMPGDLRPDLHQLFPERRQ